VSSYKCLFAESESKEKILNTQLDESTSILYYFCIHQGSNSLDSPIFLYLGECD